MSKLELLKVDGTRTEHVVDMRGRALLAEVSRLIGCDVLDAVNLRDGRVMCVDDTGLIDGKPVNEQATKVYHSVCVPGTTHKIHGDCVIAWDEDFS